MRRSDFTQLLAAQSTLQLYRPENITKILETPRNERTYLEISAMMDFLRTHSFFKALTPNLCRQLGKLVQFEALPRGHTICRQGETGQKFYIILAGSVGVYVQNGTHKTVEDIDQDLQLLFKYNEQLAARKMQNLCPALSGAPSRATTTQQSANDDEMSKRPKLKFGEWVATLRLGDSFGKIQRCWLQNLDTCIPPHMYYGVTCTTSHTSTLHSTVWRISSSFAHKCSYPPLSCPSFAHAPASGEKALVDPSSIRMATIFPCEPAEVLTLTGDEYVDALASHEVGTNSKMHSAFALPGKEVLEDINNTPPALRSDAQVDIMMEIGLRISFFHQVSSAAVKKLARVMRVMAYEGDDIIYKEGDQEPCLEEGDPCIFGIVKGRAELYRTAKTASRKLHGAMSRVKLGVKASGGLWKQTPVEGGVTFDGGGGGGGGAGHASLAENKAAGRQTKLDDDEYVEEGQ